MGVKKEENITCSSVIFDLGSNLNPQAPPKPPNETDLRISSRTLSWHLKRLRLDRDERSSSEGMMDDGLIRPSVSYLVAFIF